MAVGDNIIFRTFYRSPDSNLDSDSELLRLISYLNENYQEQLIAVGDLVILISKAGLDLAKKEY